MAGSRPYQQGDWDNARSALNRFLMHTQQMEEWAEANAGNDEPDTDELQAFIDRRESALNDFQELWPGLQQAGELTSEETASKNDVLGLLARIQQSEAESDAHLKRVLHRYGERIRNAKQAQNTVSAYSQAVGASTLIGSTFNQAK